MTFNEYQELAARTINDELLQGEQETHSLLGMASEVGELHSLYQKVYQGHEFDEVHAASELGDLLWFIAEWCTAKNIPMEYLAARNIDKLKARYPEGFTSENSLNRAEGDI